MHLSVAARCCSRRDLPPTQTGESGADGLGDRLALPRGPSWEGVRERANGPAPILPLSRGWSRRVRSVVVQVISMA
jgi:hypothetical protein